MDTIVRLMRPAESKLVQQYARESFGWVESLFVSKPKWAYVIEDNGEIVGGLLLDELGESPMTVYLDIAFIRKGFRGKGYATLLYAGVKEALTASGVDLQLALVKADNVGSWVTLVHQGFQRINLIDFIRQAGWPSFWRLLVKSPIIFAFGMDLYGKSETLNFRAKSDQKAELFSYFSMNALLMLIFATIKHRETKVINLVLSYLLVLLVWTLGRFLGSLFSKQKSWQFRFANGGIGLGLILNLSGWAMSFPVHGTFHPRDRHAPGVDREMAISELGGWLSLLLLYFFPDFSHPILQLNRNLVGVMFIFYILPFYPFDELGSRRIFAYSKPLWLMVGAISLYLMVIS